MMTAEPAEATLTKISPTKISNTTIEEAERLHAAHAEARARLAGEIASTADQLHQLQAHLKDAVVIGHRLGFSTRRLAGLTGVAHATVARWLAEVVTDDVARS
jgi:hypothetical protein